MRRARSYSIVDHELLHGGYLHRLSHQALALYLFLVVVGDREGKSYYAERTIASILRLSDVQLTAATDQLIDLSLIEYRRPYWWVRSLQTKIQQQPAKLRRAVAKTSLHSLKDLLSNFSDSEVHRES
jgi:hypothetical protein